MRFFKRFECRCDCAPQPTVASADADESKVSATSPARLLAASLTDYATREEWVSDSFPGTFEKTTRYENIARDISISRRWWATGFSSGVVISTPFTLTNAEEKIVEAAMRAFDKRLRDEREAEALSRLAAPRKRAKPERRRP